MSRLHPPQCLEEDPGYALAFVAKAEAKTRLAELQENAGENNAETVAEAIHDADEAVRARPRSGRSLQTLARAQNLAGNYKQALAAAQKAIALSPNDLSAQIAAAQARGQGQLARSSRLDEMLKSYPWLGFVLNQFPRVIVRNESDYQLTVTVTPQNGAPYPPLVIEARSLRALTVLPGLVGVTFESPVREHVKEYQLVEGRDTLIIFKASDIITTKVTATNRGNSPAHVTFKSTKWSRSIVVAPDAAQTFDLQSSDYAVTCAGSATGRELKRHDAKLMPDSTYVYDCSVTIRYRYEWRYR